MSLRDELHQIAGEVRSLDDDTASRLESLGDATVSGAATAGWENMDPVTAINPGRISSMIRDQPLENANLAWLEWARNTLVLVPIFFTWIGLEFAVRGYRAALDADTSLASVPFILLWQQGFRGHGSWLSGHITLGAVALADVIVVALLIGLTVLIHRDLNMNQVGRERQARVLENRLNHLLWRAAQDLSQRTTPAGQFDRFHDLCEQLLKEICAERERIKTIAQEREQGFASLQDAMSGFTTGTDRMLQGAGLIDMSITRLQSALDSSVDRDVKLTEGLRQFAETGARNNALYEQIAGGLSTTSQSIEDASTLLSRSAIQATSASSTTTQLVQQVQAEFATFTNTLRSDRERSQLLQRTLDTTTEALQTVVSTASDLAGLVKPMETVPQAVNNANESLQATSKDLQKAVASLGSASSTLGGLATSAGHLQQQTEHLTAQSSAILTEMTNRRNQQPRGFSHLFRRNR